LIAHPSSYLIEYNPGTPLVKSKKSKNPTHQISLYPIGVDQEMRITMTKRVKRKAARGRSTLTMIREIIRRS
jgi:hypothetical protein